MSYYSDDASKYVGYTFVIFALLCFGFIVYLLATSPICHGEKTIAKVKSREYNPISYTNKSPSYSYFLDDGSVHGYITTVLKEGDLFEYEKTICND